MTTPTVAISVIVPVYNTEKYLRRCIDSILGQNLSGFELLLIDDGSTDGSGAICDEYASADSRVRVFHRDNAGVSSARNLGLAEAKGDWVAFADSDDYLESGYLSKFAEGIKGDYDLTIQGFVEEDFDGNRERFFYPRRSWHSGNMLVETGPLADRQLINFVWNKLFRLAVIRNHSLEFDAGISLDEDKWFVMQYLSKAASVLNLPDTDYHYNRHPGAACYKEPSFHSRRTLIRRLSGYYAPLSTEFPCTVKEARVSIFNISLDTIRGMYRNRIMREERVDFIKETKAMAEANPYVRRELTLKNRLMASVIIYLPARLSDSLFKLFTNIKGIS